MDINLEDETLKELVDEKVVDEKVVDETLKLEKMWKYKLSDLHKIALKLGIAIKLGKKNKKMIDLYKEIEKNIN